MISKLTERTIVNLFAGALAVSAAALLAIVPLTVAVEMRVETTAQHAVELSHENGMLLREIQKTQKVSVGSRDILCTILTLSDVKGNANRALAVELLKRDCPGFKAS